MLTAYGSRGHLGVGVPQANPTVEPEIAALLPGGVSMHVTRLTSRAEQPRDRLIEYLARLDATLERYDTLTLDAYGFACTASSYIVGAEPERRQTEALAEKFGYPVITSSQAIAEALRHLGVGRIAMGSPYPDWLSELSHRFWRNAGFDVVGGKSVGLTGADTRAIYKVGADAALERFRTLLDVGCDCILITGTGLPSLPVIAELQPLTSTPILSSNLCLAWALRRELSLASPPLESSAFRLLDGWQENLSRL